MQILLHFFLGGANSYKSIKSLLNVKWEITPFEKIALAGGNGEKAKAGLKVVREGGSIKAMEVYNYLLKSEFKSEELTKGEYKLTKDGEEIFFRSSTKSVGKSLLDTFNKNING